MTAAPAAATGTTGIRVFPNPVRSSDDLGRSVPGGVYFLRVESRDGGGLTRKVTVVR